MVVNKPLHRRGSFSSHRGSHENRPCWFCSRGRDGARFHLFRLCDLRGGVSTLGPGRPVWRVSAGLLARPWPPSVLDTTGPARPLWRLSGQLPPWAIPRPVLGGLRRIERARAMGRAEAEPIAAGNCLDACRFRLRPRGEGGRRFRGPTCSVRSSVKGADTGGDRSRYLRRIG